MEYYNIRLQARNRMGQGLQWERQLVAVSANDSKLEHHKTLTFRYFRTDKSLALYNLFFLIRLLHSKLRPLI